MSKKLLAWVLLTFLAGRWPAAALAQAPLASADAAQACRQARLGAAARTAATAGVPVRHRQKMDRYDLKWVKLDLALENNSRAVAGSALLLVRVGPQPLDSLAFELYQAPAGAAPGTATLTIDSVVADGRRSPGVLRQGQAATAALAQPAPAGALLAARIYYHGAAPTAGTAAIGNAYSTATLPGGSYQVSWSLSEPFSAHEWFPIKQSLTDKADSSAVSVTTTLPNKVASNGLLRRTVLLPAGKVRYEWSTRHPIDYYLISVAVAPYVEYTTQANLPGAPAMPVVGYLYDQAALDANKYALSFLPSTIEYFSSLVGTYYFADEKYGLAFAPMGGGMEHQTMTTQSSLGTDLTLTAHELFHQWFGDNVTCASWEDIWLNEGFASYGEYLYLQQYYNPRSWLNDAHSYASQDPLSSVRVPDTTSVSRIFSYSLTYKKGASVVHMLRYLCHDDARFFRALRTYQQQFSGRAARTADLQRVFEAELGQPLGYFFDQWYRGNGYPMFNVRWNQLNSSLFLQVNEVTSAGASPAFFRTEVDYKLTFKDGSTQLVRFNQTQASQGFSVPVAGTVTGIEVDPDAWLLAFPNTVQRDNSLVLATRAASAPALTLFPNPARGYLTISGLAPAAATTAEVCDATGRVVLRQPLPVAPARLNTAALAPGLYFLRLAGAQGETLGQGKFVQQ
ncbi:M1 family aminopeptidase [Hymenobacter cheonanensis]|uniref:M1 family aminopeptidase n=1 Tax=Hymenobacter sp. CA2-7 TaxID=3063993 RepID=UPI00271421D8|nr:M1 family aminopeptidase [Hymenobacter sp. CA2-7]MDO7888021.1 M1 family aminopeptidase [Hymenobacter sp. CA2-7]